MAENKNNTENKEELNESLENVTDKATTEETDEEVKPVVFHRGRARKLSPMTFRQIK